MTKAATPEFHLPAWPALLTTDLACAYTQLSEASFRLFAAKSAVAPVECAGLAVTRWRKADLDALIDRLPARGAEMPLQALATLDPAPDPGDEALRKAERRLRG